MEKLYKINTTIVIVCWNGLEFTKLTLDSLFNCTKNFYNLVIIDNQSNDGTQEFLSTIKIPEYCRDIKIILNDENKGYGGAINQGYLESKVFETQYTCICNNDIYFSNNWLLKLEKRLETNKNIGIIGTLRPAVYVKHHTRNENSKYIVDNTPDNLSGIEELKYFSDCYNFEDACNKIIEVNGGNLEILNTPPNVVVTCCALIRNSVIDKIGYIADPIFEKYGSEDVDLSWKIASLGYDCALDKEVYIHHFRHKSINDSNFDRSTYLFINNLRFFYKWRDVIYKLLSDKIKNGNDIDYVFENDLEFYVLTLINTNIGFVKNQKLTSTPHYLFNQTVNIGNPIGNLYRKNHVLILLKTPDNNYILGKKAGFYPNHIARFVGGGVDKDEKPVDAAVRELNEELQITRDPSELSHLVEIHTEADTSEGKMQMITNVYFTKLKEHEKYFANDDLSSLLEISREKFVDLIKAMENLDTEFVTDKFSFKWADWAKIYSPIHKIALEIETLNKYD